MRKALETYKLKQNLYGLFQAYGTPISVIAVILYFYFALNNVNSTFFLVYFLAILGFTGYRYYMYIKRPMEIEVSGDQIKLKDILGKVTELTFSDITDIEINKRRELYISFKETKLRGLNTFKDFDRFIEDVKKKNPNTKFWGFDSK